MLALAIYLHRELVDFRQSINGLSAVVEGAMGLSPLSGAVFVFCNRRSDKLKIVYWDHSGFALWSSDWRRNVSHGHGADRTP